MIKEKRVKPNIIGIKYFLRTKNRHFPLRRAINNFMIENIFFNKSNVFLKCKCFILILEKRDKLLY